jgi:hypothetical protein
MRGWPTRLESSLPRVLAPSHWCAYWCASLIGEGGDEFAAEVGDVWDNAAADQVGRKLGTPEPVPEGALSLSVCRPVI